VHIAVIQVQEAITGTAEGKKAFADLQATFKPKQAALASQHDEIERLKKELTDKSSGLTQEQRAQKSRDLAAKQKTLQQNYESGQSEFEQAEQKLVNGIGTRMLDVMQEYAKANGYNMIVDVSNPQSPILYAEQQLVITKDIIAAYDSKYPTQPKP
jgi:outer membrane protein